MPTQKFTKQDIDQLSAWFQRRYESQFSWSRAISERMILPGTRAVYPMSVVAHVNPQGTDVSGNGLHLTNNNGSLFGYTGLIPHVTFNGTTRYLSYADTGAAGAFDIAGTESYIEIADRGMTFYSWARFDVAAAADEYVMAKWVTGGNQESYRLFRQAAGTLRGSITVDGSTNYDVTTTATLSALTWYFLALQFEPSAKLSVWVGSKATGLVETSTAAATPASIFDGTAAFAIGAQSPPANYHDGKQSLDSLHASFHSDTMIKTVFSQERALFGV